MRRKDREIVDRDKIEEILESADVCRIALNDEKYPYIVPLNYGYQWGDALRLYFHCAKEGKKIELLGVNNHVGFEIDCKHELIKGDAACDWGMKYRSIIGNGTIHEILDDSSKVVALNLLMKHYGYAGKPSYPGIMLKAVKVLCLDVHEITAKART